MRTIQVLLGHAKLEHTTVYPHLSRKHLTAVANPLDQIEITSPDQTEALSEAAQEMNRPTLEVADIIRAASKRFIERNKSWLKWPHIKVLNAIERCRTAALGGHIDQCSRCGHRAISYNSCRNRHCPKCQTNARARG